MPSIRKSKSQKMRKSRRSQTGGSPASSIVMSDATMNPPVMNDYIGPDRIRDSWYDPSLSALEPKCGGQKGGSLASDLVMEQLTQKPKTEAFDPAWSPKGDMNSLNLYETTGGARSRRRHTRSRKSRSRKSHSRKSHSRKSRSRKSKRNSNSARMQRGGASAWLSSVYAQGPINYPEQPGSMVGQFSMSGATSRNELMNPSTLGLAGSGYPMGSLEGANVSRVGAPIS